VSAERLSAHFALDEFLVSQTASRLGIDNRPNSETFANLRRLAGVMEGVRERLGNKPILISSGYRSTILNRAIGGATNSAHIRGLAADFTCPGYGDPITVCRTLQMHLGDLGIDQLIHEFGAWVHLGLADTDETPRQMVLTIDQGGTRTGLA
jgi:zinc D-Ala-D-Ala carboxypeptidase